MSARVVVAVLWLVACDDPGPRQTPPAPDVPAEQRAPGDDCDLNIRHDGTCAFVRVETVDAAPDGTTLARAHYRIVRVEPPREDGGPTELVHERRVLHGRVDGLRQFLEAHAEVACRYFQRTGSCPPPPPVVDAPAYAHATRPVPAFDSMREVWPTKLCALPTAGVQSLVRVESCNCGAPLACRVQRGRNGIDLDVREEQETPVTCDDCSTARASCPIQEPLSKNRAVLRINGRVPIRVETGDLGVLEPGRCWDAPAPTP